MEVDMEDRVDHFLNDVDIEIGPPALDDPSQDRNRPEVSRVRTEEA